MKPGVFVTEVTMGTVVRRAKRAKKIGTTLK
jgi:hypothetical protein